MRVAVMISGGGSNLQSLIDEKIDISLVVSDRQDAFGLQRAKDNNIDAHYIGKNNFPDKNERTQKTLRLFDEYKIDFIVLAGYLSIVPAEIIAKYEYKIINIHPSLIPSFCGMGYHGARVHEAVYNSSVKITGATVHFVNDGVDTGEIILQDTVSIENDDKPCDIAKKVLKIEHKILPKAVKLFMNNKIKVENGRTYIEN